MTGWKRAVGLTAMLVAVACLSFAAEEGAAGRRGGGAMSPERQKAVQAATALVDKYVAKEAGLTGEKADAFVKAMAAQRESSTKKMAEARASGGADFRALMEERTKGIEGVVDANMSGDAAKKAKELLGLMLDNSVAALIEAKVEAAKIDQAMPVLVKYGKAAAALMVKMREGGSAEDMTAKRQELRSSTAKELAPIVGEAGAAAFQAARGGMMGMGGRGGKKKE